jgi:hypothetical protein
MHRSIARLLLLAAAVALPAIAAEKLAAKTGLWETTVVTSTAGIQVPPEALSRMPPEQRAQVEQMMQRMGARKPTSVTDRSCVTEKDLEEGAFRQKNADAQRNCKYSMVSSSARHQEWTFQCSAAGGGATGRMRVDASDTSHVHGTMDMQSPQMSMSMKFDSRWLGASCAGADHD